MVNLAFFLLKLIIDNRLERSAERSQRGNAERSMYENGWNNSEFQSSSYSVSEMPTRADNPVVNDLKFREKDQEKTILDALNDLATESVL